MQYIYLIYLCILHLETALTGYYVSVYTLYILQLCCRIFTIVILLCNIYHYRFVLLFSKYGKSFEFSTFILKAKCQNL